jgi:hypothetical protein
VIVPLDTLQTILEQLDILNWKADRIMSDLTSLTAAVTAETTVEASAVTLLNQLAADIAAAGTDPVALAAIVTNIQTSSTALAAAITADTPAAPVTPPVTPTP